MVLKVRPRQESLCEPAADQAGPQNAKPTYIVDADRVQSSRLKDLWAYRELFLLLVKRDFVAVYKQTVLGPLWFFVQPFLASVVYMVVFGQIARLPTTNLPPLVFYMSGIIVWSFFSNCLIQVAATFLSSGPLFHKIYFPRIIVPLSQITMNLLNFVAQLLVLLVVIAFYELNGRRIELGIKMLALPLVLGVMSVLALGDSSWANGTNAPSLRTSPRRAREHSVVFSTPKRKKKTKSLDGTFGRFGTSPFALRKARIWALSAKMEPVNRLF